MIYSDILDWSEGPTNRHEKEREAQVWAWPAALTNSIETSKTETEQQFRKDWIPLSSEKM